MSTVYPLVKIPKRFRREVVSDRLHGQLIRYASAFTAHRIAISKIAVDGTVEDIGNALAADPAVDFFLFITDFQRTIDIQTDHELEAIRRCTKVISEDFDIAALSVMTAEDPDNQLTAHAEVMSRVTWRRDGESIADHSERVLRAHLLAAESITLDAMLGLVARYARTIHPTDKMKQATVVAYYIGNTRLKISQAEQTAEQIAA